MTTVYCTSDQVERRLSADGQGGLSSAHVGNVDSAVITAARWIDQVIGGESCFHVGESASARQLPTSAATYRASLGAWVLEVPWLASISTLELDVSDSGSWTTYASSTYYTLPLSSWKNGTTGWPIEELVFPSTSLRNSGVYPVAKVTGVWGWTALPEMVEECAVGVAAWIVQQRDARAGLLDFGEAGLARARSTGLFTLLDGFRRVGGLGLGGFA